MVFEEAYCLFFFLATLILSDPNWEYHKQSMIYRERWTAVAVGLTALGCGVGAEAILTELEVLQTLSGGAVGLNVSSSSCLGWNTFGTEAHGEFFQMLYLSSFFLCKLKLFGGGSVNCCQPDDFQSRPIWISFRNLFQGCVACPESRGLWFHFPGSWWASMSLLYLSWTARQEEKQLHS